MATPMPGALDDGQDLDVAGAGGVDDEVERRQIPAGELAGLVLEGDPADVESEPLHPCGGEPVEHRESGRVVGVSPTDLRVDPDSGHAVRHIVNHEASPGIRSSSRSWLP